MVILQKQNRWQMPLRMSRGIRTATALAFLSFLLASLTAPLFAEPTAAEIVKKVDDQLRGSTSEGRYEITVVRPRFERTMVIDSWDDTENRKSFIRIIIPKKDEGTTFLKWGDNLWQYIPKIGKEIKIEGSLLQDSWMGSDLTNDDLVRATSIVDDYDHTFLETPSPDLYRIQMVPKPAAPVVWKRVVMEVRKKDFMPVKQEFYDNRDRLARIMEYSDYRIMSGRLVPVNIAVKTIKNDRELSQTKMRFVRVVFDRPIPAYVFSRANLRR